MGHNSVTDRDRHHEVNMTDRLHRNAHTLVQSLPPARTSVQINEIERESSSLTQNFQEVSKHVNKHMDRKALVSTIVQSDMHDKIMGT